MLKLSADSRIVRILSFLNGRMLNGYLTLTISLLGKPQETHWKLHDFQWDFAILPGKRRGKNNSYVFESLVFWAN
jgi:hypothetical protein